MSGRAEDLPRKVMQICLSRSWGGLEMCPGRIAEGLHRHGWEVHGLALTGTRVADSFDAVGASTLVFRSPGRALGSVLRILRYLKRHDIRVLHAHKSSDMRVAALLVSLWPELRLFFTDHMGVKKPKKDLYHRWAYSKARRVFSISRATYEWNRRALPVQPGQLAQLYDGIDLAPYAVGLTQEQRRDIRHGLGLDGDAIAIALPGRVSASKGHRIWVDALERLQGMTELPPWQAVIIGQASGSDAEPGGFLDQLKAHIGRAGLGDRVNFAGFRSDLPDCLQAVEIACIPSSNEAFGLSAIESMAAGCAVIGSASGAIPELIDVDRGRIADPQDPDAWAVALAELIGDAGLRQRLGLQASDWVRHRFGLDQHVRSLIDYYTRG